MKEMKKHQGIQQKVIKDIKTRESKLNTTNTREDNIKMKQEVT